MARELALIGEKLIHTYPLIPRFNGCNMAKAAEYAGAWVKNTELASHTEAPAHDLRVTRMWSPDQEEMGRLRETLNIATICATVEEAIDGADGVLIMDEIIESRTALIEQCLNAGLPVYADKILAMDPAKTESLIALAESKNAAVRSWSQLVFHPGLENVRSAPPGGVAFLNFNMSADILSMYGIHIVAMLQGAFASPVAEYQPMDDPKGRAGRVLLEDGTRVFLYIGEDLPWRGRLYYCASEETEVIVNDNRDAACFDAAAAAIASLFTDGRTPDMTDYAHMVEASRLVECIVTGQPGAPIRFKG